MSASTPVRSTGSTGQTAKWFVFTSIEKTRNVVYEEKQYLQCAKLIKEALDSRCKTAYLPEI